MKLYLVQHAKAASKEADPQRPLTEEGQWDIQKVADFIEQLDLSIDYLWHSGKTRAEQTAEILAEAVEVTEEMSAHDGLSPNDDVTPLEEELISKYQDIMIVGHLPFMSKLASLLLTGSESSDTVAFRQGSIVCLEYTDDNRWQLQWMIVPDLLP